MKILICDPLGAEGVQLLNKQPGYDVDELPGLAKKDLLAKIGKYDALIVRSATRADREGIEAGKNLRVIARARETGGMIGGPLGADTFTMTNHLSGTAL